MHQQKAEIASQRAMLEKELPTFECVRKVYPSDSNFLLMDVGDANGMYDYLVEKGVIVRNRNNITLCERLSAHHGRNARRECHFAQRFEGKECKMKKLYLSTATAR